MTASNERADLLTALRSGNRESLDELVPVLYRELRQIAHRHMARSRRAQAKDPTLATTALVNEAYLKLVDQSQAQWKDRAHFLALAATVMRHILVDRARSRGREKRAGGMIEVTFEDGALSQGRSPLALLEIDDALTRLSAIAPRLAQIVEYRFYGGLSEVEVAEVLSVTVRTVQRDWTKARMLLRQTLAE